MKPSFEEWKRDVIAILTKRDALWALGDEPDDWLRECYDDDVSAEGVYYELCDTVTDDEDEETDG